MKSLAIATLFLVGLSGCGGSGGGSEFELRQSPVVLSDPPSIECHQAFASWFFSSRSDSPDLSFVPGYSALGEDYTITVPDVGVLSTFARRVGGTDYLVVATVTSTDQFVLYRYHDSNSDGALDDMSRVTLLTSGPAKMYVTSFAILSDGTTYLFDARCRDIRVANDTDSDGWPDSLETTPFAANSDHVDEIKFVSAIWAESPHEVLASRVWTTQCDFETRGRCSLYRRFRDTDFDGEADTIDDFQRTNNHPVVRGIPFDGQTSIEMRGPAGLVMEMWELDANGDDVARLGVVTLGSGWTTMALTTSPSEGDHVVIRSTVTPGQAWHATVLDDSPQIVAATPNVSHVDEGAAVTLTGHNFTATGMTVTLRTNDGEYGLPITYSDATSISVTFPTIADADSGPAEIEIRGSGTGGTDPADDNLLVELLPVPTGEPE